MEGESREQQPYASGKPRERLGGPAREHGWGRERAGVGRIECRHGAAKAPGWRGENPWVAQRGAGVQRHAYRESGIEKGAERESRAASSTVIPPASARIFISEFSDVKLNCVANKMK